MDISKFIPAITKLKRHSDRVAIVEPQVLIRHGEHRLSVRYEVLNIEYDVNNNRIEIVTGEEASRGTNPA